MGDHVFRRYYTEEQSGRDQPVPGTRIPLAFRPSLRKPRGRAAEATAACSWRHARGDALALLEIQLHDGAILFPDGSRTDGQYQLFHIFPKAIGRTSDGVRNGSVESVRPIFRFQWRPRRGIGKGPKS